MGTRVDIVGWGGDGMAIVNAVVELVARHEELWSVYRPTAEISRLNASGRAGQAGAGGADVGAGDRGSVGADDPLRGAGLAVQGGHGLVVSADTDRLLEDALALARATGGAFNPLIGPLVAAWDVKAMRAAYLAGAPLPPAPGPARIRAALRASDPGLLVRIGQRRWLLRAPGDRPDAASGGHPGGEPGLGPGAAPGVFPSVDLGGVAKGYTADACRDLAVDLGAAGMLVSVGTSSVAAFGTRADGSPWRVGVRDPDGAPTDVCGVVELPADGMASLSTSGDNLGPLGAHVAGAADSGASAASGCAAAVPADQARADRAGSGGCGGALPRLRDHHIIDPRTGRPACSGVRQVSVVASSGVLAEALSTAILVDPSCVRDEAAAQRSHAGAPEGRWRIVRLFGEAGVSGAVE